LENEVNNMNIVVGSDHRGLEYKRFVIGLLQELGHPTTDCGSYTVDPVDYPDVAKAVCEKVIQKKCEYGILICGTGIGMSIAANKIKGIRAALVWDDFGARRSREHNDANILCLGAERGKAGIGEIIQLFLNTPFEGGRHQKRLDKLSQIENE
jgi:ribose 5-phosphate isomerase B